MKNFIKTLGLISAITLMASMLVSCSTENPYNPFVCDTAPKDELMVHSLQAKTINHEAIADGVNLGAVKVSASSFAVNTDFVNLVNLALSKLDNDHVVVVYTDINACNQVQYLYAKFILTQLISHGIKTDKLIFVDKKSNEILKADNEASVSFEFVIVEKSKL